jgi:hypothetical protein
MVAVFAAKVSFLGNIIRVFSFFLSFFLGRGWGGKENNYSVYQLHCTQS